MGGREGDEGKCLLFRAAHLEWMPQQHKALTGWIHFTAA